MSSCCALSLGQLNNRSLPALSDKALYSFVWSATGPAPAYNVRLSIKPVAFLSKRHATLLRGCAACALRSLTQHDCFKVGEYVRKVKLQHEVNNFILSNTAWRRPPPSSVAVGCAILIRVDRCYAVSVELFRFLLFFPYYWHCLYSMRSRVYATDGRPSVCLSHTAAARRCCGFAAVGPASRRCRVNVARPALSCSGAAAAASGGRMRAVPRCQLT